MGRIIRITPARWGTVLVLLAVLLAGLPGDAGAQEAVNITINEVDTTRFPEVVAYATVIDDNGRAIVELPKTAFALTEGGTPVSDFEVDRMENAGEPILLVLALDTSGSMRGNALKNTQDAAAQLIRDLGPADKVAVLSFADTPTTHLGFTTDKESAVEAVQSLQAGGETALHDAIVQGVELLAGEPRGRKTLVALTDGEDTVSGATMESAIQAAQVASVPVYAIGFGGAIKPAVLTELAGATGGHFYQTPSSDQVEESFEEVAKLLRHQYVFRYESSLQADDQAHTLRVTVEVEGLALAADEAPFTAVSGEVHVRLQGLADGDTVGGQVSLKPIINAPGQVVQVDYSVDGEPLKMATTGDLSYEWDASAVPLGEHTLTVRATDRAGNVGQVELTLVVAEAVVVHFVTPTGERPVGNQVPVEVGVTALAGVAKVEFAVDGREVATAASPPWGFTWDTASLEVLTHTLSAIAYDVVGQSAQASLDLWVGMRLALRGFEGGDTVGGLWMLEPVIVAPADPVRVEYLLDGVALATETTGDLSYEWDASAASPGEHTLAMRVTDREGTEGQLDLTVTVTEPVAVTFLSPPEEDLAALGREVEVEVEVTALNEVERVVFSVDDQVVERVESEPYRFLWDTTAFATGEHRLSATAYDVKGQSDQVSLDVWIAFRGASWGLWVAVAVLLVGGGVVLPFALRKRRKMVAQPAAPISAAPTRPAAAAPVPGTASAMAWLIVEEGPEVGHRWPVPLGETSLGRSRADNDIVTPSRRASRRHAAIRADREGWVYYDLEPTNPTLINDVPIVGSHELAEGDRIRLGDVVLRFTKEA